MALLVAPNACAFDFIDFCVFLSGRDFRVSDHDSPEYGIVKLRAHTLNSCPLCRVLGRTRWQYLGARLPNFPQLENTLVADLFSPVSQNLRTISLVVARCPPYND